MPAAAVIPAPIAYIKVVAVKKLVVGFLGQAPGPRLTACRLCVALAHPCGKFSEAFIRQLLEPHLLL